MARYVRLNITKTRSAGSFYAQIGEIEVYEAPSADAIHLVWTAPGDDGALGRATSYDLRFSTSPMC